MGERLMDLWTVQMRRVDIDDDWRFCVNASSYDEALTKIKRLQRTGVGEWREFRVVRMSSDVVDGEPTYIENPKFASLRPWFALMLCSIISGAVHRGTGDWRVGMIVAGVVYIATSGMLSIPRRVRVG